MAKTYEIVAVYDNLTESFLAPQFVETLAEAQRIFETQINTINIWKNNASDFDMYSLGKYDAETGVITSSVHKVIKGTAVLRRENSVDLYEIQHTKKDSNS